MGSGERGLGRWKGKAKGSSKHWMIPGSSRSSVFSKRDNVDGGGMSATTAAATMQVSKPLWWYTQAWALHGGTALQ
jgi:hypothetical protein